MRNGNDMMKAYLRKVQDVQADMFGVLAINIDASEDGSAININVFEKNHDEIKKERGDYRLWCYAIYDFMSKKKNDAEFKKFMNCVKKNNR